MQKKYRPLCSAMALLASTPAFAAYKLTTVYNFKSNQVVSPDGGGPRGGLGVDANGLLYGTTFRGGTTASGPLSTIFETGMAYSFDPVSQTYTALGNMDGSGKNVPNSWSNLIPDVSGNMYGTTQAGGSNGTGNVFVVAAGTHAVSTLVSMPFSVQNSFGGLVGDGNGNLYGATTTGIYSVNIASKSFTTIASFPSNAGTTSYGNLYRDNSGNLYGTNSAGGTGSDGTIFKMNGSTHVVTMLATFAGSNGAAPEGGLVADAQGNLYGTTSTGGTGGKGTVFELNPTTDNLNTLANFDGTNGNTPVSSLVIDSNGDLFGSTHNTLFEIDAATRSLTTLASFSGTSINNISGTLWMDSQGDLFGTAFNGGTNSAGVIFEASPVPEPTSVALLMLAAPALLRRRLAGQTKGEENERH